MASALEMDPLKKAGAILTLLVVLAISGTSGSSRVPLEGFVELMATDTRSELIIKAELAEKAERYEDMAHFMKEIAQWEENRAFTPMNEKEIGMLQTVYLHLYSAKLHEFAVLKAIGNGHGKDKDLAAQYAQKVRPEILVPCREVLKLLPRQIGVVQHSRDSGSKALPLLLIIKAKFLGRLADLEGDDASLEEATEAFKEAHSVVGRFPNISPLVLDFSLSHARFLYDLAKQKHEACGMAYKALQWAMEDMDKGVEGGMNTNKLMQQLRESLTTWMCEEEKWLKD